MAGKPWDWSANTMIQAMRKIYSDCNNLTPEETIKMFERSGRTDACIVLPYVFYTSRVLDFAGGIGRVAKQLSKYVGDITIVDVSQDMINFGKEYCSNYPNISFIKNDTNIPIPSNTFDVVYLFLCACHLEAESKDIEYWLGEFRRVLKPNGVLIYDTPNPIEFKSTTNMELVESFKKYQLSTNYNTMIYVYRKRSSL